MTSTTTKPDSSQSAAEMAADLFDNWFDPIEIEVRARAREFIEEMIRGELVEGKTTNRHRPQRLPRTTKLAVQPACARDRASSLSSVG